MTALVKLPQGWFRVALTNFAIAGFFGLIMRTAFVVELPFINYRNVMHGHSHVAMLGWIYLALYALIVHYYSVPKRRMSFYNRLFWITQIAVMGMAISFPLQGYGPISIAFSALHVFLTLLFGIALYRDLSTAGISRDSDVKFLATSFIFLLLSSLAIISLPVIILTGLRQSALYYAAVQFFLHFQFNGFYIFAAIALFLRILRHYKINVPWSDVRHAYWLLSVSCLMTYALAVTWSTPVPFLFWINSTGVVIQLIALVALIRVFLKYGRLLRDFLATWTKVFMGIAFFSLAVKIAIQGIVVVPTVAVIAYTIRNFVIGFIHLILLGSISSALFAFAIYNQWLLPSKRIVQYGLIAFLAGVVTSESILFLQGTMLWAGMGFFKWYYEIILAVSVLIPVSCTMLIFGIIHNQASHVK